MNKPAKAPVRIVVGTVMIGIAALIGIKVFQIKTLMAAGFDMPPQVVTAVEVKQESWDSFISTVGSLEAKQGTVISAETLGKVTAIHFESGQLVKAGDPLITQESAGEQAQLSSAEATLLNAKTNLERGKKLIRDHTIAQADFDRLNEQYKLAIAAVENIRTQINKKTLRAPFDGQLGVRQVQLGAVIDRSDPVVTLQNIRSLYVNFLVPQAGLSKLELGQSVRLLSHDPNKPDTVASITTISPEVNSLTRNVQVQATLPNNEGLWRPGMFVDLQIVVKAAQPVLTVPVTSVVYAPYGNSVYVVEKKTSNTQDQQAAEKPASSSSSDLVLKQSFVQVGEQRGDFVAILSGVNAGDQVVSSGVFKLHNGQSVTIDNTLQPDFQAQPTPSDN